MDHVVRTETLGELATFWPGERDPVTGPQVPGGRAAHRRLDLAGAPSVPMRLGRAGRSGRGSRSGVPVPEAYVAAREQRGDARAGLLTTGRANSRAASGVNRRYASNRVGPTSPEPAVTRSPTRLARSTPGCPYRRRSRIPGWSRLDQADRLGRRLLSSGTERPWISLIS